ncbi:MAG: hypothetical protein NTX16_05180 [Actinobacteria bacterium]|nr:hypothetical protein [Actinomycetota bacterium]
MTTVQIVGIAVAAAIVLLLIIALLVTRRRGSGGEAPAATAHASFLDDAPQDTLSTLGKAEQPMEDITLDPGAQRESRGAPDSPEPTPETTGTGERDALGLDRGTSTVTLAAAAAAAAPPEDETTGELPAVADPAPLSEGVSAAAEEAAAESGSGERRVPLSDIIVTTSRKMVDLQDPEVRRMLTDLVRYEIDQATHYRRQGQTIDAVLQLTEAEKISRALDMRESAAAIRKMMEDLQGQV